MDLPYHGFSPDYHRDTAIVQTLGDALKAYTHKGVGDKVSLIDNTVMYKSLIEGPIGFFGPNWGPAIIAIVYSKRGHAVLVLVLDRLKTEWAVDQDEKVQAREILEKLAAYRLDPRRSALQKEPTTGFFTNKDTEPALMDLLQLDKEGRAKGRLLTMEESSLGEPQRIDPIAQNYVPSSFYSQCGGQMRPRPCMSAWQIQTPDRAAQKLRNMEHAGILSRVGGLERGLSSFARYLSSKI